MFGTTPALVSYDDGQGNSQTISYPVPTGFPNDRIFVKAGPSGDVVVELTFWRPQRRPIPPETGEWIDMGGLAYYVAALSEAGQGHYCAQDSYSSSDPNLVPREITGDWPAGGGYGDLAEDQPASPANTITFKLNLTECFDTVGLSLEPGEGAQLELGAITDTGSEYRSGDQTAQRLNFFVP